jgi:hypothetical protein
MRTPLLKDLGEVADHAACCLHARLPILFRRFRVSRDEGIGPLLEILTPLCGNPQQLRNDRDRQRIGQIIVLLSLFMIF